MKWRFGGRAAFVNVVLTWFMLMHWVHENRRLTFWEVTAVLALFIANFIFGELAAIRRRLEEGMED